MKISILTGPWLPVPTVRGGGAQKIWHGLALEMSRQGHDVTLVARSFPGQAPAEVIEGVRYLRSRGFSQGRFVGFDLAKDLVYALNVVPRLPVADILVTNDFWVPLLAARFRRTAGAVVVSAGRFPKGQYRLYRRAARIVANSRAVREAIVAEQPVLDARTVLIPNPVPLELFEPRTARRDSGRRKLFYAGRIHPEKGIELLLRAFTRLSPHFPDWHLELVGPTRADEGGGGELFAGALRELSRGHRVDWREPIWDPVALAAAYVSADAFCYPSLAERGESFGLAPLESMAAGVPPVVSDLACFRDFVRDGENGWIFDHRGAGAEERLAEVLARAMTDEPAVERMRAAARREAEGFGYVHVAQQYLAEFERILAEVPSKAQR